MQIIGTEMPDTENKNKKMIKIILIIVAILFIISIALVCYIIYLSSTQFKFTVDDKSISSFSEDLFIFEEDNVYISIKDFASLVGYTAYNGGYGGATQFSEDTTKCYIQSSNEIASFEMDSNKIYKTEPNSEDEFEYFTLEEPVKYINNKLYLTPEGMSVACNVKIAYSKEKNSITVMTLPYLVQVYTTAYTNAGIQNNFKNQKAILYDMLVITDESKSRPQYGVYSISEKREIIGTKYTKIEFVESTREFIVTTSEQKVGIITANGQTKVTPQYNELKQIDRDLNLYVATNSNGKKGILERNGKILIYLEYDEIGIDTKDFSNSNIKNKYLLFDNCIPVKQNGKIGLYDKRGNLIVPIEYDTIGCVTGSNNKLYNNVITIPEVEGIVLGKELTFEDNKKQTVYTVINSSGKELVPLAIESIYSITSEGREEYVMVNQGVNYNVLDFIARNTSAVGQNNNTNSQTGTNTVVNENSQTANTVVNEESQTTSTSPVENEVAGSNSIVNKENEVTR